MPAAKAGRPEQGEDMTRLLVDILLTLLLFVLLWMALGVLIPLGQIEIGFVLILTLGIMYLIKRRQKRRLAQAS
jgi:hypothetical protein